MIKRAIDWLKTLIGIKKSCAHDWRFAMFQKLTDDNTVTYKCAKCGKYEQR
jgi:hypothetical protein